MRRFSALAFTGALIAGSLGAARAQGGDLYALDIPIDVVLVQAVSTENAHAGDTFYFKTVDDVKLGALDVPPGTPGTGRLSVSVAATDKTPGRMSLQADSLTVGSQTIWVNIDTTVTPRGHYTSRRDLVLDPGMKFRVRSIAPRKSPAPLLTPPPPDTPTSVMPGGPTPSASGSPTP